MARYINADDVLTQKKPLEWSNSYEQGKVEGWNNAIDYISNFAPAADVVEVTSVPYDCVSRQQVRGLLHEYMNTEDFTLGYLDDCYCEMPAVDVKPVVRGEWILHQDSRTWECSVCGEFDVLWRNFCHNCGADMRGES